MTRESSIRLGMRGKLFAATLGLVVLALLIADTWVGTVLAGDLEAAVERELFSRARLLVRDAALFEAGHDDLARWDALADELGALGPGRVTFLRPDGIVIGDSEIPLAELAGVESHRDRPEVIGALAGHRGSSTRRSATLDVRLTYVAVPFHRGDRIAGVVRVARPLDEVDAAVSRMRGVVLIGSAAALVIATLISSFAAAFLSRRARALAATARRLASGDLAARTRIAGHDELAELGRALDQLAGHHEQVLRELRAESELVQGVLRGMREGVLVVGRDGRVVLANAALREMLLLGFEVIGKTPLELIRNAELRRILDVAASAPAPPAPIEIELDLLEPRRLMVHASGFGDVPGAVLAVFIDVTHLRRLENVRREFVANVSHELRTPIATMSAAAETLHGVLAPAPGPVADLLEMIERNAERLRRLVEDLLDLSRFEARELRLAPETLTLLPVARALCDTFRERAHANGVDLVLTLPPELAARADRRALEQVLGNLIENAVKYAGQRAQVRIEGERDGQHVRVRVRDNGPGIEARHLPRLFERFYRVDDGRSRDGGGTGLGLAIVKHLVEAMGGSVRVESVLGRGSTFELSLPAG